MSTDWRALCEELVEALDGWHQAVFEIGTGWVRPDETYLLDRARAALAEPLKYLRSSPTRELLFFGKPVRADLAAEPDGPTLQLPEQAPDEHPPSNLDRREVAAWYHGHACGWQAARAVLARFGNQPAPPAEGEVAAPAEPTDAHLIEQAIAVGLAFQPQDEVSEVFLPFDAEEPLDELLVAFARAAIAADRASRGHHSPDATKMVSPAEPPAEGEVAELARLLRLDAHFERGDGMRHAAARFDRAADLLERHPAPVPAAERLPGPEDCDGEGRCWWWDIDGGFWEFFKGTAPDFDVYTHWLPFHALPLPAGEVE